MNRIQTAIRKHRRQLALAIIVAVTVQTVYTARQWPIWMVWLPGYFWLNLCCCVVIYHKAMKTLRSPYAYIALIMDACDEATYPNDQCKGCGRWKGRGHLAHCAYNPDWK